MASNSNSFVPQMLHPSASLPIRAPLTLDDDDDDDGGGADFDVSSNATLSDTASHSDDASETPSATAAPFVADPDDDYFSEEEELSPTPAPTLRVTPVAHLSSTYDDDDESEIMDGEDGEEESEMEGDEESEMDGDDELLTVVRVPQNSFSAPRIKVMDAEEEEEEEQEQEQEEAEENCRTLVSMNSLPVSQSLLSDEFSNFSLFNDVCSDDDSVEPEDDIDRSVRIGLDDDDDALDGREGYDECSIASDSDVMLQYSPDNLNNEQFGKVRVVLDELEEGELYEIDRNEGITMKMFENDASIMQRKLEVDTKAGISVTVGDNSLLKSNVADYDDGRMVKRNSSSVHALQQWNSQPQTGFCMTGDPVSEAFAETAEYGATQRNVADGSQDFAFAQGNECEELVSMTKHVTDSNAKLDDSSDSNTNLDVCEDKLIQSVESSELLDPTLLQETSYFEHDLPEADLGVSEQDDLFCNCHSNEYVKTGLDFGDEVNKEAAAELNSVNQESKGDGSALDGVADAEGLMSIAIEQFKEQISALSILLGSKGSEKNSQQEQLVRSSHANFILARGDAKGKLTNLACGNESDVRTVAFTSAGESSAVFLKDPGSFSSFLHCKAQAEVYHNLSEKDKENIQRIQDISVKFLRLVLRVNLSLEDSFVSKVLCRLVADIGRRSDQELIIKTAKVSAEKLEEDFEDNLDFSLNILVLGKSGVGKSATINSIFGDMKVTTNAFEPATTALKEVSGTIDGIKIRILDTPGLMSPMKDQSFNKKILSSIKRYMNKFPVDVILYVDRLDSQTRDLNDLPMLKSITSSLSPSVWQRAILTLTHAASTPLEGPSGSPLSYDLLVVQKSYLVQQSITRAVDNLCQLSPSFMCPVSLVENHPLCGEFVLPNGLRWRSQLLALCISLKIISEVSSKSGTQTLFDQWKHFFLHDHSPPLSHTFSSLWQPHAHLKFKVDWN